MAQQNRSGLAFKQPLAAGTTYLLATIYEELFFQAKKVQVRVTFASRTCGIHLCDMQDNLAMRMSELNEILGRLGLIQ